MNPREQARARQLAASGLNPQQVQAAVVGRRQAIADSWHNQPDPNAVSRWMGHAVSGDWPSCVCCPDPERWSW